MMLALAGALALPSALANDTPSPEKTHAWLNPIWLGGTIEAEPVLFLRDPATGEARATLLFAPSSLTSVRSANETEIYQSGRDYIWNPGSREITLTKDSRIVSRTPDDLRRPPKSQKYSLPHRDGKGDIYFAASDEYHQLQTRITYTCAPGQWTGRVPHPAPTHLAHSLRKLREPGEFTLVVLGDSISSGCNASGWARVAPFQPPYPELVQQGLASQFGRPVTLKNLSLGGSDSAWAVTRVNEIIAAQPDLVVIAFGMNDAHKRPAADYRKNVAAVVAGIRAERPDCDVILVASMLGNLDWTSLKPELFPQYRDALLTLAGDGVAVADMTSVWEELLRHKTTWDLTGNGVNHPNDFGHRLYAQVILTLLRPPAR